MAAGVEGIAGNMNGTRKAKRSKTQFLWVVTFLMLAAGILLVGAASLRSCRGVTPQTEGAQSVQLQVGGVKNGEPLPEETPGKASEELIKRAIVLIVDDVGFSLSSAKELLEVKVPLTWSIIPYQSHSLSSLKLAKEHGIPAMLHLPMEAEVDRPGLKYQVNLEMDSESLRRFVKSAAGSLPGVIGVNNHRGSRATSTPRVMEAVLSEIQELGLIFVDSRTSGKSVAFRMAREMKIPTLQNEVFLDHEASPESMRKALERAFSIARKKGTAVVIAHARPETLKFLKTLSQSRPEDIQWITVPEAVRRSPGSTQGGMKQ
mgnify:CR=1 FL=1